MNYEQYKHNMNKRASWVFSFTDAVDELSDLGAMTASALIASTVLTGAGLGWIGAKVASKDAQDIARAKKLYDSERLKADLGYLSGQLQTEHKNQKRRQESQNNSRSMRLL